MKGQPLNFTDFKKQALKNPKIKAEYERLQPEFALINAVLKARKEKGLTQSQLAAQIGSKQSVISRLESGKANPSIAFLKKLAHILRSQLEIKFVPAG